MAQRIKKHIKTRSSKVYCQEKFACQGERAEAVYECEDCGSRQCHSCDVKLHELEKLRFHDRKRINPPPPERLCQQKCRDINYADVTCNECESNFCFECFDKMHTGKKAAHRKTPFSILRDMARESNRNIQDKHLDEKSSGSTKSESRDSSLILDLDVNGARTPSSTVGVFNVQPEAIKPTSPLDFADDSFTYFSLPQDADPAGNMMSAEVQQAKLRAHDGLSAKDKTNANGTISHKRASQKTINVDIAATIGTAVDIVDTKMMKTSVLDEVLDEGDSLENQNPLNGHDDEYKHYKSFMLADDQENLKVIDQEQFVDNLGCEGKRSVKVVSIFGNTGDGKSHTLNHTFFNGHEVFKTSANPESCTIGVWAAFDPVHSAIIIDTEGLLGISANQNQRTRLLLKVMAISDVVIYRTRADRLTNDLFQFLGDASKAFHKHFKEELTLASERCNFDLPVSSLCPAVIIFHETLHTDILGKGNATESPEVFLRRRFRDLGLTIEFSSIEYVGTRTKSQSTDFRGLLKAVKSQLENTKVRAPRTPGVVLQVLKVLNTKFSGDIEKAVPSTFPDQYFTCSAVCLSCGCRCSKTMNHGQDGIPHETEGRCKFQHQFDNKIFTCKSCFESKGKEIMVLPKTCASSDNQWFGLAKYAWSGYVLECPQCGIIYRSRQFWYGNQDPVKSVVRTEIRHVWPGGNPVLQGTHNAARRILDGLHYLSDTVVSMGAGPAKVVGNWVTDQIAPPYWVPNSEIKVCTKCTKDLTVEQIHHCRRCGQGFCDDCTAYKRPVPERGWGEEPVRVCEACYNQNMTDSNDSDGDAAQLRARKVTEVISTALGSVASAIDYPLDVIKDSSRPTYWVPDHEIKECCVCKSPFGPKLRIHHCRACGQGVCDECSPSRRAVKSRGWDHLVRVCQTCNQTDSDL